MNQKRLILILSIVLLLSISVLVYFFAFKEVIFVTDASWDLLEPKEEMNKLRLSLALKGRKLTIIDFESFFSSYENYKGSCFLLILSPVSSAAAVTEGLELSSEFDCVVVGLGAKDDYSVFDMVLKSYTVELPEGTVDYRYSANTDSQNIYRPLLTESIIPLINLSKEEIHGTEGVLVYGLR